MTAESSSITLTIKTLTNKVASIKAQPWWGLHHLSSFIQDMWGIPPDQQRLVWQGKNLVVSCPDCYKKYGHDLGSLGITNNTTVHLQLRLRGGGQDLPYITDEMKKNGYTPSTYRISCLSSWYYSSGSFAGLIFWKYNDWNWTFDHGIAKGHRARAPYVFIIDTNSKQFKDAKNEVEADGWVHGHALWMLTGLTSFRNIRGESPYGCRHEVVCTGFAILNGETKYKSNSVQTGLFTDNNGYCTPMEKRFVDAIVKKWKQFGPGHHYAVPNLEADAC